MRILRKVAYAAIMVVLASSSSKADPPFGNHAAYLAPVSQTQVVCQITNVTCLRVAAYVLENVAPWSGDKGLVDAVAPHPAARAQLSNREINKLHLAWIERTDEALIDSVMNNDTSKWLTSKKLGAMIEIFVFDQYGLNVAQTDPTQDYNQGDEAKYWRTFMTGPGAIYIDQPRDDAGRNVAQASLTITDAATGKAVGGMTVGVDVDRIGRSK